METEQSPVLISNVKICASDYLIEITGLGTGPQAENAVLLHSSSLFLLLLLHSDSRVPFKSPIPALREGSLGQ